MDPGKILQDLKDSAVYTFKKGLGVEYAYDEPVRQNLRTPSVQVLFRSVDSFKEIDDRIRVKVGFNVNVFTDSLSRTPEMDFAVLRGRLMMLRYLTDFEGKPLRHINNLKSVRHDDVLVSTFDVDFFVKIEETYEIMRNLIYTEVILSGRKEEETNKEIF